MDERTLRERVEEALESGRSPEDVCRDRPELASRVREHLERARALEGELDALFPTPVPGERAPTAEADLPDVPGYDVEGVLGRGGMGVVYRARHRRLDRPVALKMLLSGAWASPAEVGRFLREAEAVARLRHPNIVQVYDVGELRGRPYFTMELVEGGSLASALAGVPQPARDAAGLVATLADAVQAAHASGVVHRDLKPANILIGADGAPKVGDFGLARRLDDDGGLTLSGARLGTPSYMAPEQALGRSRAVGPAVDVYALGALLYEALTGRPPFRGETATETERMVIERDPLPPSRLNPRVPRDLETVCLKCLRKEPERRYGSADALAQELRRFLRGEPVTARPIGRPERVLRWARRKPAAAALVATSLALVALAAGVGVREWALAARERAEAGRWLERLAFVQGLQDEGRFADARAILGRVPDGGSDALRARIAAAQAELAVVERLDGLRLERAGSGALDFDLARAERAYEDAFAGAGLWSPDDSPEVVARRVAATGVRAALVAALDDWACCARDPDRRARLLEIARRADPDPWRDRVRDPRVWQDPAALAALAREASPAEQSVPLCLALAELLGDAGGDADAFLRRVQLVHPEDFWVAFTLAERLGGTEEAVGYYRAALALRPRVLAVHVNLANVLAQLGRLDEAMDTWDRALELDPGAAVVHLNVAVALVNRGRWDQALASARRAVELDPDGCGARAALGEALLGTGRPGEARDAFRAALALCAEGTPYRPWAELGLTRCDEVVAAERRLLAVLDGGEPPPSALEELVLLAEVAVLTRRHAAAAALYGEVLARAPSDDPDLESHRYDAVCAAARAGVGDGLDAADTDDGARAAWRREALEGLRADVAVLRGAPGSEVARRRLADWRRDPALAGLREPRELTALPADERAACAALWSEVDALLGAARLE